MLSFRPSARIINARNIKMKEKWRKIRKKMGNPQMIANNMDPVDV